MVENHLLRQSVPTTTPASQVFEQQVERGRGHRRDRLADRGQLRPDRRRRRRVIEADNGEVARHVKSAAMRDISTISLRCSAMTSPRVGLRVAHLSAQGLIFATSIDMGKGRAGLFAQQG